MAYLLINQNLPLGTIVDIVNDSMFFNTYEIMAKQMGLKNWKHGFLNRNGGASFPKEDDAKGGTIIAIDVHGTDPDHYGTVYGIRMRNGHEHIFGGDCLKVAAYPSLFDDDLFEVA